MQELLLYIGSGIIFLWGIGHLLPTRDIVSGFGDLTPDNRRVLTMEWVAEGLTLCFIGVLVAITTLLAGPELIATRLVIRASATMLLVLAALSAFTGARTAVLPMKLCPWIKSAVALMYLAATLI